MVEDASLDDFLDADSESEDDGVDMDTAGGETDQAAESSGADGGSDVAETDDGAVESAVTTYAWSPEGEACAECGKVVKRRWTQDGHLVCGACKRW